tara:strand:+ start:5489 stop:5890 length:402 start_codon:yes stop_codon:yes gene_type:complete
MAVTGISSAYIGASVRSVGLSRAVRALSKAGVDSTDMKQLMYSIGMIVVRASNVPVLTGRLASTLRAGKGKTKAVVRIGGAKAPYAGVIHYGYPARNIQPAPFVLEALVRKRQDVINRLDEGISDILRKNNLI